MKRFQWFLAILMILVLTLTSLLAACAAPASTTTAPATTAPTTIKPSTTTAPTTTAPTTAGKAKPEGELVAAVFDLSNESFLPWTSSFSAYDVLLLVNDVLIYYEETTGKFLPGLAERWEVSADALTTTFYLRKGIQWHDGWGEVTAADVKYNFEKNAGPNSTGAATQARQIDSM
jgi:peptide/nickel transport system substrate-binding protein